MSILDWKVIVWEDNLEVKERSLSRRSLDRLNVMPSYQGRKSWARRLDWNLSHGWREKVDPLYYERKKAWWYWGKKELDKYGELVADTLTKRSYKAYESEFPNRKEG